MNCRRTRSLLSAYCDAELAGYEMLQIRDHLSRCGECHSEHASLIAMKRMLSVLPDKEPRPELEMRLHEISERRLLDDLFQRLAPVWFVNAGSSMGGFGMPIAGRRIATACLFSLVGVWFILAPSAMSPRNGSLSGTHARAMRLLSVVGFTGAYSLVSAGRVDMSSMIDDPLDRRAEMRVIRFNELQPPLLAETRAESVNLMIKPRLNPDIAPPAGPSQEFGDPNVIMTGYSVPSH